MHQQPAFRKQGGGGTGAGGGGHGPQPTMDKPKREAILDLSKYVNEKIRVKFTGGREGTLPSKTLHYTASLIFDVHLAQSLVS